MTADYEQFLKQCDQPQLRALLTEVGTRLGTVKEQGDDLERAQAIAHQLSNLLTVDLLRGTPALLQRPTLSEKIRATG